jgi:hypothetical protein
MRNLQAPNGAAMHAMGQDVDATLRAYRQPAVATLLVDEVHVETPPFEATATMARTREMFVGVSFHRRLDRTGFVMMRQAGNT